MMREDLENSRLGRGTKFVGWNVKRNMVTPVVSETTAGNVTYTAAGVLGGIIVRDPNGASRTDVWPTAALLVASAPWLQIGDVIETLLVNGADANETITLTAGTGGGYDAAQIAASRLLAQNSSKIVHTRMTGVATGSEAYVMYY